MNKHIIRNKKFIHVTLKIELGMFGVYDFF